MQEETGQIVGVKAVQILAVAVQIIDRVVVGGTRRPATTLRLDAIMIVIRPNPAPCHLLEAATMDTAIRKTQEFCQKHRHLVALCLGLATDPMMDRVSATDELLETFPLIVRLITACLICLLLCPLVATTGIQEIQLLRLQ